MAKLFDVLALVVTVTGIMVLVRPGSQGPQFVTALGNSFQGALATASGSGTPAGFTPSAQQGRG